MGKTTGIGWTDHTFNFAWGCSRVSAECLHCYIEGIMKRAGREPFGGPIRTKNWSGPRSWNREAKADGVRRRVFTCSMSDFFHVGMDPWRDEAWELIRECDQLDWLVLTKRSERIPDCLPPDWGEGYDNVWLGVTCGCKYSYYRLPHLESVPARVKFISAEPLLERLDFRPYLHFIDWVITACEQAGKTKRRLMDIDWVRDIDRQCRESCTAHYFKQYYRNNRGVPVTDGLLDGNVRHEFPTIAPPTSL